MNILIVEDDLKIANLTKKGLEMNYYSVESAHTGPEGLAKAQTGDFDLIVLDVMLPGMDGLEIARTLRQKNIATPIIMLTARGTDEDRALGLEAGANDYLVKPFSLADLTARINALLRRERNNGIPRKTAGNTKPKTAEDESVADADEKERRRITALNERILDTVPLSVITIDKEGFITSANRYYLNLSRTEDYHNINIFQDEFFIRENLVSDYKKLLTEGTMVQRESCYEKNNRGEDKYLKILAVPLRDKNGDIEGALSMALDNTEAVLFKNKLQELNKNLELKIQSHTAELKKTNQALNEALASKAAFLKDVSREIQVSLAVVQENLDRLNHGSISEKERQENYDKILAEINKASARIDNLAKQADADWAG